MDQDMDEVAAERTGMNQENNKLIQMAIDYIPCEFCNAGVGQLCRVPSGKNKGAFRPELHSVRVKPLLVAMEMGWNSHAKFNDNLGERHARAS